MKTFATKRCFSHTNQPESPIFRSFEPVNPIIFENVFSRIYTEHLCFLCSLILLQLSPGTELLYFMIELQMFLSVKLSIIVKKGEVHEL
jgi:hypothetical protein